MIDCYESTSSGAAFRSQTPLPNSILSSFLFVTVVDRHMATLAVSRSVAAMVMSTVSQDVLGLVLDDLARHGVGTSAVCRVLDEAAALGKLLAVDVGGSDVDAVDADVAVAEIG
jgi:hypothetical protein